MLIFGFTMKRIKVSVDVYEELKARAAVKGMSIEEFVSFLVQLAEKGGN
jgi:predicted CopG family antitoxin